VSTSRWYSVVIDAHDIKTLASFWQEALGYHRVYEADDEIVLSADAEGDREPGLVFGIVPEGKTVKNRLHIDLAPDDRDAEVERLLALGATRADVGQQGDETWVVLADPEGNEFCVLSAR
jgi:predicted enzyme related to lactoylglutathione lyase